MTVTTILFLTTPDAARASDVAMSFSPEQIGSGRELYDAYCARCHGAGMVEPGESFFDLRTFPSDQRSRFFDSVSNGKNSMPPWRSILSEADIANLFAYVASGGGSP